MRQIPAGVRRTVAISALLLLLLGLIAPGAGAEQPLDRIARAVAMEPVRLMVQFEGAPLADDNSTGQAGQIETEHQSFQSELDAAAVPYQVHGSFRTLFNGVAVTVPAKEVARIRAMRGVTNVFISHKTDAPAPLLSSSARMIGAEKAWAGDAAKRIPGVDGSSVTVAVIDTGIDYTHPDLGGCLGPGCRVIAGRDFVGPDFDGTGVPHPGPDPMDLNGHGTHVAGIIGAKAATADGVTGVAPGARFVALKVFGKEGSTYDDIVLQAMEAAYHMKVDVVNMSLGSAFAWPESPTAKATERLARKGIFLAASAGNEGASGEFAVGAPAVGEGSVAVGSFENDAVRHHAFIDPEGNPIAYEAMTFSPAPPQSGQSPELVYAGLGQNDTDFQNPDGSSKVAGKVALISRGAITFREKSQQAQQFGAVATIIFNNAPGMFLGTLGSAGNYVPTLSISQSSGERLLDLLDQGPVHITWQSRLMELQSETAGLMSGFSSWGPGPDLSLKPDLTAPGGSIFSTYPVAQGSYAVLSGTSMASPHVAGAAALLLQARREMFGQGEAQVKPTVIRNLLMNTAHPRTQGPDSDKLYPVHLQGAGLIDVWAAISAQQRITPDKLALGALPSGATVKQQITIQNLGNKDESYTFRAIGSEGPAVTLSAAAVPLRVKARAQAATQVQITVPDELADGGVFSGYIEVVNGAGATVAHVPYLGFKGDYQVATTLDAMPPLDLPWLAYLEGPWLNKADEVTIRPRCQCDADAAYLVFSLARHAQELKVEIWDAATGRKYGNALDVKYLGRDDGAIQILGWNGTAEKGRAVPGGTYVLRMMVLRPLGDPKNPDHWDLFTTGKIHVVY